jgi:hypothetical protein
LDSPALEFLPVFCLYDWVSSLLLRLSDEIVLSEFRRARGSASSALLLAVFLVLVVATTVSIFALRLYPAPPPISHDAVLVDRQYNLTLYATGVAFLLAQLGLA